MKKERMGARAWRAMVAGLALAGCDIPPGGLDFNSPEWFETFRHAASEARRLGLEICIPNCSGWSSSGGPWNPPSNGFPDVNENASASTFTATPPQLAFSPAAVGKPKPPMSE